MRTLTLTALAAWLAFGLAPAPAAAQDSKSAPLVRQLVQLLDTAQLECIAARDADEPDRFVAAMHIRGGQLLVISGKYRVPEFLAKRLAKKDYREAYLDVMGSSVPESKLFVEDMGADGLWPRPASEGAHFDIVYERVSDRTILNGDWKGQKTTEQEYLTAFARLDAAYARMIAALISQIRPQS